MFQRLRLFSVLSLDPSTHVKFGQDSAYVLTRQLCTLETGGLVNIRLNPGSEADPASSVEM